MRLAILRRKVNGWSAFQPDEEWEYISERDGDVCRYCEDEDFAPNRSGDTVPGKFPDWEWQEYPDTIKPRYHIQLQPWGIRGQCRCRMEWRNMMETLTQRLAEELDAI